jgi:cation diffusion facilitator family transporter
VTNKNSSEGIAAAGLSVAVIALVGSAIAVATSNSLTLIADLCSASLDVTAEVLAYATFRIQRSRQRNLLDYGVGKVETLASLFIGLLTAFSVVLIVFNAIESLVEPTVPTGFGITLGLVMSVFFGGIDGWLWWRCRREYALNPSPIAATQTRMNATACITAVGVASTLGVTLLTHASWVQLLDMLMSITIGAFATNQAWQMIRHSLHDVLDQSLAEPLQMIVNQHLVIHFDAYESLEKVRSRSSGSDVFIEISLSFQQQATISSIQAVIDELTSGLEQEIRNSHVTVVASAHRNTTLLELSTT